MAKAINKVLELAPAKENYDSSDDDISSDTDTENEKKPPEKITIERSTDLDTLKKAFISAEGKPVIRQDKDLDSCRIDKKFFNEIASTFEKPCEDAVNESDLRMKIEREKIVLDKEAYAASKSKFDSTNLAGEEDNNVQNKPKIEIERSESDKKRVQKVFYQQQQSEEGQDLQQKNCEKCQKLVFHVEKMKIGGKLFHKACVACHDCQNSLLGRDCVVYKNLPYCKYHALKILQPDKNTNLTPEMAETMQISADAYDTEDGDLEVVNVGKLEYEDLENHPEKTSVGGLASLSSKKKEWEESQSNTKIEKRSKTDMTSIEEGRVKSRLNKFTAPNGNINGHKGEPGEVVLQNEDFENANIGRPMSKKRDELKLDVDAKGLKSKFEDGTVNTTSPRSSDADRELNMLKSSDNIPVKDRFKPRNDDSADLEPRKRSLDDITPATAAFIHETKEKFAKGEGAFNENQTGIDNKHREILTFTELNSVKEKFESGLARKSEERQQLSPSQISKCHELGSLKASFEAGGKKKLSEEEVEAKRKKQLETEFRRLQIEKGIFNERQKREAEEEAKNQKPGEAGDKIEKTVEMGSLKERFELGTTSNIDQSPGSGTKKLILEEFGQIDTEASKSIKAKFEKIGSDSLDREQTDEKRKNIQAEFEIYKELKEKEQGEKSDEEIVEKPVDSDLALAAEHAQKMKVRWDKIQKKEAKKAQKAAAIKPKQFLHVQTSPEICKVCSKSVYLTEKIECDGRTYHKLCFKCQQCSCLLRIETYMPAGEEIFCRVHYKTQQLNVVNQHQKSPEKLSPQPKASQRKSKQDEKSYFEDPDKSTLINHNDNIMVENGSLKIEFATEVEESGGDFSDVQPSFGADRLVFENGSHLHEKEFSNHH